MNRKTPAALCLAARLAAARFAPLLLATAMLASACRAGDAPLSVAEYSTFCADSIAATSSLVDPDDVTWAELQAIAERSRHRLDGVTPPESLQDVHRATERTLDLILDTASDQPPNQAVTPFAFGFDALRIATQFTRAVNALPPELRSQLEQAECL